MNISNLLVEMAKEAPPLQAPLSGVKQQRLERKVNYEKNKKNAAKWLNQVKKNRESDFVDYTVDENRTRGATLASMATEFVPKNSLEQDIQNALVKDGMATDKDIMNKEKEELLELDPEEMKRRMYQMSKLKTLLFRQELKNKRLSKIKSKLYHKIKRKSKEKQEGKLMEELELIDPEAAREYREKIEEKRVDERISLRHGTNSKFAKNLKRYGKFDNDSTKQAYFELIRQRDELKKKTKKVNDFKGDDSEADSSGNDSDPLEKLKIDALLKINQQLSESESEDSDSDGQLDEEKIEKKRQKILKKEQNKQPGIMGMKFMRRAEEVKKEVLKIKSKALIDEINAHGHGSEGDESEEDSDEDNQDIEVTQEKPATSHKFKGEDSKTAMPSNVNLESEDVKEIVSKMHPKKKPTAVTMTDHIDKVITSGTVDANALLEQWQGSVNKLAGKKRKANNLTFNESEDLKEFDLDTIKNRKRIKFEEFEGEDSEEEGGRKMYVTNEDMEQQDFEKQKQNLIEEQMEGDIADEDKKNDVPKDGWGSWAGEGITKSRDQIMKEHKRKERKIKEIKEKRRDAKKSNVIINESRDKKFTKYMVSDLPHPYKSAGQFEQLMKIPLGKEWNTISSYKRLIQPEVVLKAGKIIKPLKFRKDISLKAVDALLQNRKDPTRPAAKF